MTAVGDRVGVGPGEPGYAEATGVFNLFAPVAPARAVVARTVTDVVAAVELAAADGRPVRMMTTGHSSAAIRPMTDAVLIRTELAEAPTIDPGRAIARIPAGTRWADVAHAAQPYHLAAPHGTAGTVGAIGYLLGGGMSFYSRQFGLAANRVTAIELVTADGRLRRVDARDDAELFWALRGGGGGFGVVTAVEIALFPLTRVTTGAAFWPGRHALALAKAWQRWTLDAPPEAGTSLRVMNLPDIPEIPAELKGGPVVCVAGAVTDARAAADLLGPLRAIAEPVDDTWAEGPPTAVLDAHLDPPDPVAVHGDHFLLSELGDDGIAAFVAATTKPGSPLVAAELRQLGGAASTPNPAGGVLNHFAARYAYMVAGLTDEADLGAIKSACAEIRAELAAWNTGRTAPNFVENFAQPQGHLTEDDISTVDAVRARTDPNGLFADDIVPGATALSRRS